MATYNGSQFLDQQIESILAQSYTDWKLSIRDDGSTDETPALLRKWAQRDTRIEVVVDDYGRRGFNGNFSALTEWASSKFIMYCDQDDVWLPQKIERMVERMVNAEIHLGPIPLLIHSDSKVVDENLNVLQEAFIGRRGLRTDITGILLANSCQGACMMINQPLRSELLHAAQVLPYDYRAALLASAIGRRIFIAESLMLYRQHGANVIGALGIREGRKSRGKLAVLDVTISLAAGLRAAPEIEKALQPFWNMISAAAQAELRAHWSMIGMRSGVRKFWAAAQARYCFSRRWDRVNLLLYCLGIASDRHAN